MKKAFNYYLDNHFLDFIFIGILLFSIYKFDIIEYIDLDNKSSLYSSLIGVAAAIWGFGALSATILVSISPNELFKRLLAELGNKLLKNIFISLIFIFISIILFLVLSIKIIQNINFLEAAIFLFAFCSLIINTIRFSIILYRILKIRIG
ncbi:MAG: hypothetical protein GXO79_06690 [Chlorobi bacterium]|nr:hypothetical protein [Chlorobiota bacterium]